MPLGLEKLFNREPKKPKRIELSLDNCDRRGRPDPFLKRVEELRAAGKHAEADKLEDRMRAKNEEMEKREAA